MSFRLLAQQLIHQFHQERKGPDQDQTTARGVFTTIELCTRHFLDRALDQMPTRRVMTTAVLKF